MDWEYIEPSDNPYDFCSWFNSTDIELCSDDCVDEEVLCILYEFSDICFDCVDNQNCDDVTLWDEVDECHDSDDGGDDGTDCYSGWYDCLGVCDNKHRARIKILIDELGLNEARRQIYEHYNSLKNESRLPSTDIIKFLMDEFSPPDFSTAKEHDLEKDFIRSLSLKNWAETNLTSHHDPNHVIVSVSLKKPGATPGDATAKQMRVLADLAQQYAYDELCVSHEQNIILPHVPKEHVVKIYNKLDEADLATSNIGMVSDIISCPGMDYCKLATARSIPIAKQIATRFCELKTERDIGPLKIKISGCINACGHHHVGHIGILGLDRRGVENYQITEVQKIFS